MRNILFTVLLTLAFVYSMPAGAGSIMGETVVLGLHWENPSSGHGNYEVSWFYGMTLLGDPTINFRHQVGDVCVENLTLSSFPSDDYSNLVLFKAGSTITISENFEIPPVSMSYLMLQK